MNAAGLHDAQGVTGSSPVRPTEKVQVSGVQGAVAVQPESRSAIRLLPNGSASEITAAHGGRAGAGTQRLAVGAPQPLTLGHRCPARREEDRIGVLQQEVRGLQLCLGTYGVFGPQ